MRKESSQYFDELAHERAKGNQGICGSQSILGTVNAIHTLPPIEMTRDNYRHLLAILSNENQPED